MFMSPIAPDPTAGYYEAINCHCRFQTFSCQYLVPKMKVSIVLFSVVAGLAVASPVANAKMVERVSIYPDQRRCYRSSISAASKPPCPYLLEVGLLMVRWRI
jgi:hypothetical protein